MKFSNSPRLAAIQHPSSRCLRTSKLGLRILEVLCCFAVIALVFDFNGWWKADVPIGAGIACSIFALTAIFTNFVGCQQNLIHNQLEAALDGLSCLIWLACGPILATSLSNVESCSGYPDKVTATCDSAALTRFEVACGLAFLTWILFTATFYISFTSLSSSSGAATLQSGGGSSSGGAGIGGESNPSTGFASISTARDSSTEAPPTVIIHSTSTAGGRSSEDNGSSLGGPGLKTINTSSVSTLGGVGTPSGGGLAVITKKLSTDTAATGSGGGGHNNSDPLLAFIHSHDASSWVANDTKTSTPAAETPLHRRNNSVLVDISPWEFQFEEMQVVERLGYGSFGAVYLAKWNEAPIALKILVDVLRGNDVATLSTAQMTQEKLIQEAGLLGSLRHPNIVNFLGFCRAPPCVATELCSRGSVYGLLQMAAQEPEVAAQLTWHRRLSFAIDAAKGMVYLHSRHPQILHRDLKSPNLLVGTDWAVKIADLNLSKMVEEVVHETAGTSTTGGPTNPRWLGPEILQDGKTSPASDVFSMGIVLWELLTWELPWRNTKNPWTIVTAVLAGERPRTPPAEELPGDHLPPVLLESYLKLMERCWAQDPEQRPTFQQVLQELLSISNGLS